MMFRGCIVVNIALTGLHGLHALHVYRISYLG